jgi:Tol biopolymer transport system component
MLASAHAAAAPPAFVLAYEVSTGARTTTVYAVRADGSDRRQLTSGTALDFPNRWSPDGSKLVFEQLDPGETFTWLNVVGIDGGAPVAIGHGSYDEWPQWSSNGAWLAFQEQTDYGSGGGRAGTTFDLWASRPDGSGLRRLGSGGHDGSTQDWVNDGSGWAWSPRSRWVAFAQPAPGATDSEGEAKERIAVADVTAGRVIAHTGVVSAPEVASGWAWSPDGRRIGLVGDDGPYVRVFDVLKRHVIGGRHEVMGGTALFAGDRLALSTFGVGWDWSPHGRWLALAAPDRARRDRRTGRVPPHLVLIDPAGGRSWAVPGGLSTASLGDWSLETAGTGWLWSPDGNRLALLRPRRGSLVPDVSVIDVTKHAVRRVGQADDVAWSPDGGVLALAVYPPTSCRRIRLVDAATGHTSALAPTVAGACDSDVAWAPDGSSFAFTRTTAAGETLYTAGRDGSRVQTVTPAESADALQWPTRCSDYFSHESGWIVFDTTGAPHLVSRPTYDSQTAAIRC